MSGLLPEPGLVIPYVYLWRREADAGAESGRKVRPSLVVVTALRIASGRTSVVVCPITSQAPGPSRAAVQMPRRVKAHLGLDAEASWIICDEYNEFDWPSVDLELTPFGRRAYGFVPDPLISKVRSELLSARAGGRLKAVRRSE